MELRPARPEEALPLQQFVQSFFEGYREFAPAGWEPPDETRPEQLERVAAAFADPASWSCVVKEGGEVVGYTMWQPAERRTTPGESLEELAHVRAVFVAQSHWGTGLATSLLRDGVAEMGRRGFKVGRLFTPAPHARARRFYEREGWSQHAEPYFEDKLGLDMVEYRRALG